MKHREGRGYFAPDIVTSYEALSRHFWDNGT